MRILLAVSAIVLSNALFSQSEISLEGSWEMKSFINHREDTSGKWISHPDEITFQKHISGGHFTWFMFNNDTKKMLGMGGGTYEIDDRGKYVENLDFFYPSGSDELGQSIPFDVKMKGKKWYHTGYAKVMDVGLDGSTIVVDSVKIEEIWTPIKPNHSQQELIGSWELLKSKYSETVGYEVTPEVITHIKIVTGSHFVWIKYDSAGDRIFAAASGETAYKNGLYTENVSMSYPTDDLMGMNTGFNCEMQGSLWKLYAEIDNPEGQNWVIDEFWTPRVADFNN